MEDLALKSKRVKLTDIAKAFGVSIVTASNAINGQSGVSPAKAEAIRRYAREMGYAPSYVARSLAKGRTNLIGICIRGGVSEPWENPWLFSVLAEMEQHFYRQGFHVQASIPSGGVDEERAVLERFAEFGVEAAIIGPMGALEEYNALSDQLRRLRYVMAFDALESLPIDHVKVDAYRGGQLAVEYLASAGHKKIAAIGVQPRELRERSLRGRLRGFLDTVERLGLQIDDSLIVRYDQLIENPDIVADVVGNPHGGPTALFCHNDWVAGVAIRSLWKRGLRVPEDISVLGFDNQPIAQVTTPAITSIAFDLGSYVEKMVNAVVGNIDVYHKSEKASSSSGETSILRWELEPSIVARESVKNIG